MKQDNNQSRNRNFLTLETPAARGGQARSDKIGDPTRSTKKAEAWARWMFETRHAIALPDSAALVGCAAPGHFDEYLFVNETAIPSWWERVTGPRGGRGRSIFHPAETIREPITAPFEIPEWCRPVRFADNWHACHQAGLSMDECEMSGENLNYRPDERDDARPSLQAVEPSPAASPMPSDQTQPSASPHVPAEDTQPAASQHAPHAGVVSSPCPYADPRPSPQLMYYALGARLASPVSCDEPSSNVIPIFLTRKSPDTG